jgi:pimeloyl-ACP methyl ester carboxylesterase
LVREYISGASNGTLEARWIDELVKPWCGQDGQRAFYRQIAELSPAHTRSIAENLGNVQCPVRVGWGERDPWIPVTQAAELAERLPGSVDVFTIPEAGHLVPLEASDRLATDIATWLNLRHGEPTAPRHS